MDFTDDIDLLMNIINTDNRNLNINDALPVFNSTDAVAAANLNNFSQPPANTVNTITAPTKNPTACIKIIEQPSAQRFRYECESRSAGSIPGVNSTAENKTYPTIEIEGYSGEVVIVVSCVTKDEPYRPHPHRLVGKDCKDGICTVIIRENPLRAIFSNIGIQCVKKRDMKKELTDRMQLKKINPFGVNVGDMKHLSNIDLNIVRLCFEAFIKTPQGTKRLCSPVVSQPIFQKKSNLVICTLCSCSAKVSGGDDIILLCNEVSKDDINIRFFEQSSNGKIIWEDFADFKASDVHKQTAIKFKTPRYSREDIDRNVKVFVQLVRPSDGSTSEAVPFEYYPSPDEYKRKRLNNGKSTDFNLLRYQLKQAAQRQRDVQEISRDLQQSTSPFLDTFKVEPNKSPQYFGMSNVSSTATSPSPFSMYGALTPIYQDIKPKSHSSDTQMPQMYSFQNQAQNMAFNGLPEIQNQAAYKNLQGFNYDTNIQINFNNNNMMLLPNQSPHNQFENSNSSSNYDYNQQIHSPTAIPYHMSPQSNESQEQHQQQLLLQQSIEEDQKMSSDNIQTFSGLSDLVMELFNDPDLGNLSISN